MIHLTFTPTSEDAGSSHVNHGHGRTLLAALADLERDVLEFYAADDECAFLENGTVVLEFPSLVEDLSEVGGSYSCYDMSTPEDAFRIDRLPDVEAPAAELSAV